MHQLRDVGVRLAMDDFGTGTSSLGCLRDYPFDVIKIDRSFVNDLSAGPDTLAVIHATITLVENLGKCSVAEGVETAEQLAILQSLGCHYAQGYFLGHPLPESRCGRDRAHRPCPAAAAFRQVQCTPDRGVWAYRGDVSLQVLIRRLGAPPAGPAGART